MTTATDPRARLEEIRAEIRAESVSMGELSELANLAPFIAPGDVELREWAGVPEFPADPPTRTTHPIARELLAAERDRHAEWLAGDWSSRTASGQNAAARHRARLAAVHAELDRLDDEERHKHHQHATSTAHQRTPQAPPAEPTSTGPQARKGYRQVSDADLMTATVRLERTDRITADARMAVWDETANAWTLISLPRHAYAPDPDFAGLRRWCRTCRDLFDERWTPEHDIHRETAST